MPQQRAHGKRSAPHWACGTLSLQHPGGGPEGWDGVGLMCSVSASVEHLLQIRIQEHPGRVQLFSNGTELQKGWVHFLKVLPGTVVGLWKQPNRTELIPRG